MLTDIHALVDYFLMALTNINTPHHQHQHLAMAPPSKNNQIVHRPESPMPALSHTEELEQLMVVDVIEAEPLAMVPPPEGLLGPNLRSIDHVFGSTEDPPAFLQAGILVAFSHPEENAREIFD